MCLCQVRYDEITAGILIVPNCTCCAYDSCMQIAFRGARSHTLRMGLYPKSLHPFHSSIPSNLSQSYYYHRTPNMTEVTNRNEVRAAIAEGGWNIVWGDLINEWDIVTLIVSIPTGTVGGWMEQQLQAQLQKFGQSLGGVSDEVVKQATAYLADLLNHQRSGERDINGLGVKAGIATYKRHLKTPVGDVKLPNNHQPYFGMRVTKPLPSKGSIPSKRTDAPIGLDSRIWYRLTNEGAPGLSLDIVNDGSGTPSGKLQMATTANVSGQYWSIRRHNASDAYYLSALYQGPNFHLDVYGDDKTKPHLAASGNHSGQKWKMRKWVDGTYNLSNEYSGEDLRLNGQSSTTSLAMGEGLTQHWQLTAIKSITEPAFA
jgi:hypothetical protein